MIINSSIVLLLLILFIYIVKNNNTRGLFSCPIDIKRRVIIFIFLILFTLIIVFFLDNITLFHFTNFYLIYFSRFISLLGDYALIFPLLLMIYSIFYSLKKKHILHLLDSIVLSVVITAIAVQFIKFIFARGRPYTQLSAIHFFQYKLMLSNILYIDYRSFISGHSALFFALITPIIYFFDKKWLTTILVLFGVMVMISRMALGMHWLSDVIDGAILGFIVGKRVADLSKHPKKN